MRVCDETFWSLLKTLITGRGNESTLVSSPYILSALARVRKIEPLTWEMSDLLFATGVIAGGCVNAMNQLDEPVLIKASAQLYSKLLVLYPLWLDMTIKPAPKPVVQPINIVQSEPAAPPEEDKLASFLKRSGFNPTFAGKSLDEMVDELRNITRD